MADGPSIRVASGGTTQLVHVIPLGWEFDRAVLPFLARGSEPPVYHAHRFHLLVAGTTLAKDFPIRVEEELRKLAPVNRHSIQRNDPVTSRIVELEQVLEVASQICVREMEAGNRVHINVSAGSKLAALAAGLAGMAHLRGGKGSVYYVVPERYSTTEVEFRTHGLSIGMRTVQELDLIPFLLPEPLKLRLLSFLRHRTTTEVDYREVLAFLREIPGSGFRIRKNKTNEGAGKAENVDTTRMVRILLAPLEREGLVEIVSSGRMKQVRLTAHGRLFAALSALDQPRLRRPL